MTPQDFAFKACLLIPSFNSGQRLQTTVSAALASGFPVRVVVDGSTDGSDRCLDPIAAGHKQLTIQRLSRNRGKGAAVFEGALCAAEEGFSHILTMDSDGQHPADRIPEFIRRAKENPNALIMGRPIFGPEVPFARLKGRKLTIWWTDLETHHCGLGDTLFGMRVYPLASFIEAMRQTPFARGFDFDPEIAVRMVWNGCRPIQVDAPVRYFSKDEGGVSHFNYLWDNLKLTTLHFRLVPEWLLMRQWKMRLLRKQWQAAH